MQITKLCFKLTIIFKFNDFYIDYKVKVCLSIDLVPSLIHQDGKQLRYCKFCRYPFNYSTFLLFLKFSFIFINMKIR